MIRKYQSFRERKKSIARKRNDGRSILLTERRGGGKE